MGKIVDQFGRPIDTGALQEVQSARAEVVPLRREFAEHPSRGMTPKKLAELLEGIEAGDLMSLATLGQDIERKSAHVHAELGKRKRALFSLDWEILPPKKEPTDYEKGFAAELKERLLDIETAPREATFETDPYTNGGLEDVLFDMMDALLPAYSCLEIAWHFDGEWTPTLHHRDPSWFVTPRTARNRLMLRSYGDGTTIYAPDGVADTVQGMPLQSWGWVVHVHKAMSGYLCNSGLTHVLAWPYLFENYGVRDLAELLHILGVPPVIGTYPRRSTAEEKNTLFQAVMAIGKNARGTIPEGMRIEFFTAANTQGDHFMNMIRWAEEAQSKAIVGGTLTTSAQGGTKTNALGLVHENALWDLTKSDARQLQGTLTRDLLYPLAALNSKQPVDPRRPYRFVFDLREDADLKTFGDGLGALRNAGYGKYIPVSWVQQKTGIPLPVDGEAVLDDAVAPMAAATRTAGLTDVRVNDGQDEFDRLAADLADEWQPVMEPMLKPLLDILGAAKTPDEFMRLLAKAAGEMNMDPQTQRFFEMFMMMNVYGRSVPQGA